MFLWVREVHTAEVEVEQTEYKYQTLKVKKKILVLFHSNLMHKNEINNSEKNRIAYTFSIIKKDVKCSADSYMKPVKGNFVSLW